MASLPTRSGTLPPAADPPRARGAAVVLRGVTRVFGATPGVIRVDLSVDRGESVLLRGPNGAGKTTLLRIVATAIAPTYGTGSILGLDLLADRLAIRRRTELLGHRTRLYEDLTARENLVFACRLWSVDPRPVPAVLERVGLADTADERVRGFSQGMRQRVALARVLLRLPEVLLLDEPYAGLDASAKDLMDEAIAEARDRGATVLLATHQATRGGVADRTIFMEGGRVLPELGLHSDALPPVGAPPPRGRSR